MKKVMTLILGMLLTGYAAAEVAAVAKELASKAAEGTITYADPNGWLYSRNELQHLAKGELTGGRVAEVSECKKRANADPKAALADFNEQLKALGIELILVPVPPKSAFYPPEGLAAGEAMSYLTPYYEELAAAGIEVLDLAPVYLKNLDGQLYCRTDAHWSPTGIELAAAAVAARVNPEAEENFAAEKASVTVAGDLARSLNGEEPQTEELELQVVPGEVFSEASPVLVIGDSHTLFLSVGGDMLAERAGFCEQLARKLGAPVDRLGVKGSAATAVRVNMYRKASKSPDWLAGKKVVIYCFSAREFTESPTGWVKVPVLKN